MKKSTHTKNVLINFAVTKSEHEKIVNYMHDNRYRYMSTLMRSAIFEKINNSSKK